MARMFVEGVVGRFDTVREASRKLMADLDEEAARAGCRVVGDVTISEVDHALISGLVLRLEAEVAPWAHMYSREQAAV